MDIGKLEELLRKAWAGETSSDAARWTPENPAWGQCAITTLIVNDYLGGRLLWASATLPSGEEISHYFNEVQDGSIVDLTRVQFPEGTHIPEGIDKKKEFPSTRDYVLSYPATAQRYALLKQRVQTLLE